MDNLFLHRRSYLPGYGYASASAAFSDYPSLPPIVDSLRPILGSSHSVDPYSIVGRPIDIAWSIPHQLPAQDLRNTTVSQSLRPRKTLLKPKRRRDAAQKTPHASKVASKVTPSDDALAKEVRELHALWRNAGKEEESEPEHSEETKTSVVDGKISSNGSKKRKQKKQQQQKRKQAMMDLKPQEPGLVPLPTDEENNWANGQHLALDSDGWGDGAQNGKPQSFPMTEEEKQLELQRKACKNVIRFMGSSAGSEESEEEEFSNSEEDEEEIKQTTARVKAREDKAFEFFVDLFEENQELRKLYVDNCNCGKFECLVCTCIGGKSIKKFGDLTGLVMHALKILRTKKRPEHRGYGRAVCSVLGWDARRNPFLPRHENVQPRGCIPPCDDDALDEAIREVNKGLEGTLQDNKGLTDVKVEIEDEEKLESKDMVGADELPEEEGNEELELHLAVTVKKSTEASVGGETPGA